MNDIVFAIILGLTLANVSIALAIKVLAQFCDSAHAGTIVGMRQIILGGFSASVRTTVALYIKLQTFISTLKAQRYLVCVRHSLCQ